jgi:hypothetical protein
MIMMEAPFKNWYAIVNCGCWYVGMHISKDDAEEEAIRVFNVHHSKGGYCIVDADTLKTTFLSIKDRIDKDYD